MKSFNLSDKEIKLYSESMRKVPLTLDEIKAMMSEQSEEEIQQIIDNLVEKKLLLQTSSSLPHYVTIPPIAAILNSITELIEESSEAQKNEVKQDSNLEKFQDDLFQDLERISQDLLDATCDQSNTSQTTEVLSEVELNVKKFAEVILTDIIKLITPLKNQSAIDARDINKLITAVKKKVSESEEIAGNMFSQFRAIVKDMENPDNPQQVDAFKTFIRNLGESLNKRINELSLKPGGQSSLSARKFEKLERSLYNILTDYISNDGFVFEKLLSVSSYEKIREIVSILIDKSTEELTIIVPSLSNFIPLEKLNLDSFAETKSEFSLSEKTQTKPQKPQKKQLSISKQHKQEFEQMLDNVSKKVSELKGFEISHHIAEVLSKISEIHPESVVIESIQGWLNRLLVIRKHLDSNTQYLLLEHIEKWKKEYTLKVEVEIEETTENSSDNNELEKSSLEKIMNKKVDYMGPHITFISSEDHNNKYASAIREKPNFDYLRLLDNKSIAILGDKSYLVFGIFQKIDQKPYYDIIGFYTTFRPLIDLFIPIVSKIKNEALPSRDVQINKGFNEVIENINEYSGRKIAKRLKKLLDVAFENNGISLNLLELKLLIGKIEKLFTPLSDELKEYVINELNRLNSEFSSTELIYPPEFRPPLIEERVQKDLEEEMISEEYKVETVDPDKINKTFEIFLKKIGEFSEKELKEQIEKLVEVVLELQGYPQIIKWKKNLTDTDEILEESKREQIKSDLLRWKWGILNHTHPSDSSRVDQSSINPSASKSKAENSISVYEEEYFSPGLSQSQFQTDDNISPITGSVESSKKDPSSELRENFETIEKNFSELSGIDISKCMQNIVDIILETEGYSVILKDIKDWVSKLRKIKNPLSGEIKEDFVMVFFKWKEKYVKEDENNQSLDFGPSIESPDLEISFNSGSRLSSLIDKLIQDTELSPGNILSISLQEISDIVLKSHGAVTANVIRQWISRLRSTRSILEDKVKKEFLDALDEWKEKFA
ncbi:MAG: hypothetical protein ACFFCC_02200 [Promethearchaeota archaeon]